jgi:translation initiation factor IF-3
MQAAPVRNDGPRINEDIRVPKVLLIDHNGEKQGIMPTSSAIEAAMEAGLDLVEVSPNSDPPVCKILDYGKYKFEEQKKKNAARKRQKVVEIKEIKLRPNIDTHDYDVKAKAMHGFFEEGDKVKVTLRFRGRELAHPELGMKLLQRVKAEFEPVAKVEYEPRMEGKQMIMILAPR